jgi:hypothetical protein
MIIPPGVIAVESGIGIILNELVPKPEPSVQA